MIGNRSRAWWQHFSAAGVLLALASCSSEAVQRQEPMENDEPGAIQGELSVQIADFDDGTSETRYFLRNAEGVEQRLAVSGEMDASPGKKLRVWGQKRGDILHVAKYKVVNESAGEGIGSQAQKSELIDAAVRPGRVLCAALVNIDGGVAKTSLQAVKTSFHEGAGSVNAYYRENSFGQVGLDGGTYGPFDFSGFSGCNYSGLASSIKPMVKAQNAACQQFAFVFGPGGGCGWSGLGQVGTSDKPASDTWYADSVSCVVAVQEPGHNYGMHHSSSITCGGQPFADDPASACTHSEYGDKFDTMGGGCYHMNAWQKLYQKWFGGCNGVRTTSSGKFNLYPIESPCNGIQVLQLPFPGGKTRTWQSTTLTSYYLELRTAVGFDSKYGAPSVLIHAAAAPVLPNQANPKGYKTWVLPAGGAAAASWGLKAGGTFSDPAGGLTITVESVSTASAVIDVNYTAGSGTPVCLDGGNTPYNSAANSDCTAPPPPPPDTGSGGKGGAAGTGGAAGKGGAAGTSGGAGTGGAAGTGGTGGVAGTGGTGGVAGTGGTGGVGGAGTGGTGGAGGAGTGGAAGKGGMAGTGGATGGTGGATGGTGGATGGTGGATGGTGGATGGSGGVGGGSAGTDGKGGAGGTRPPPTSDDPGCGCRITPEPVEGGPLGALLALGLGGLISARRRSRRKSDG